MDEPAKFDLASVGLRLKRELIVATGDVPAVMRELLAKLEAMNPPPATGREPR